MTTLLIATYLIGMGVAYAIMEDDADVCMFMFLWPLCAIGWIGVLGVRQLRNWKERRGALTEEASRD